MLLEQVESVLPRNSMGSKKRNVPYEGV